MKREWLAGFLYILFGMICVVFLLNLLPTSTPLALFLVITGTQAILTVFHAEFVLGTRRLLVLVGLTLPLTFLAEFLGTRTGLIFGHYYYGDGLGPKILDVPVAIPIAWLTMLYPSWLLARLIVGRHRVGLRFSPLRAALGGLFMVGWDLSLDPALAIGSRFWVWEGGGFYLGIPFTNFVGWWFVSFVILLLFELLTGPQPGQIISRIGRPNLLPFLLYQANLLFASALCFSHGLGQAGGVGLICAGLVAILVLFQPQALARDRT
jgi:uncharacterized membrane protein